MEKNLRTTELKRQDGLVKEAALKALGGSAAGGYTLLVTSPRRSLIALKSMGVGLFLTLAALVHSLVVLIQRGFVENAEKAWIFHWGWDGIALAAGLVSLVVGAKKFLTIELGQEAAAIFDGAVLRTGPASWFTVLSALVYTRLIETNIVVRQPVRHAGKDKPVELDFVFYARWQVADALKLYQQGVEAVWLLATTHLSAICTQFLPDGDYEAVMARDLQEDQEWQGSVTEALRLVLDQSPLRLSSLTLADVRPPEYLRQEEEKARQARAAEEKRIADLRANFETRRSQASAEADFSSISADIKEASLSEEITAEEMVLTSKAKRGFTQEAKRRSAEARERVRQAAQAPVKALIDGLDDASLLLDDLCARFDRDPTRVLLFLESQRLAEGSSRSSMTSRLTQLADSTRVMIPPDGERKSLPFYLVDEEPADAATVNGLTADDKVNPPPGGPDSDKEKLGTVPLEAVG